MGFRSNGFLILLANTNTIQPGTHSDKVVRAFSLCLLPSFAVGTVQERSASLDEKEAREALMDRRRLLEAVARDGGSVLSVKVTTPALRR